jgi:hypothetical protein
MIIRIRKIVSWREKWTRRGKERENEGRRETKKESARLGKFRLWFAIELVSLWFSVGYNLNQINKRDI